MTARRHGFVAAAQSQSAAPTRRPGHPNLIADHDVGLGDAA
jgi:hypothetical protein